MVDLQIIDNCIGFVQFYILYLYSEYANEHADKACIIKFCQKWCITVDYTCRLLTHNAYAIYSTSYNILYIYVYVLVIPHAQR